MMKKPTEIDWAKENKKHSRFNNQSQFAKSWHWAPGLNGPVKTIKLTTEQIKARYSKT
jgi:hypothetical protein